MKSVNEEMKRGARRKEDQYLGLVDEVFGYFEEVHENCNLDLDCFILENKELESLRGVYKKNDTVKGFDITLDCLQVELDLDYGDLEEFVGEEEYKMIHQYKMKIKKLADQSKKELDDISSRDVIQLFIFSLI